MQNWAVPFGRFSIKSTKVFTQISFFAVLIFLPLTTLHARGASEVVRKQALAMAMNGKEIGQIAQEERHSKTEIVVEKKEHIAFERSGTKVEMNTSMRTVANSQGIPLHFRYTRTDKSGLFEVKGQILGGTMRVTTSTGGSVVKNEVELPPGARFYSTFSSQLSRRLGTIDETVPLWIEELSIVEPVHFKMQKTREHCPKKATCFLLKESFRSFVTESVLDDKGVLIFGKTEAVNTVVWPLNQKPPPEVKEGTADLMQQTTWPAPEVSHEPRRVRFRVTMKDALSFHIPEDSRQRVVGRTTSTVDIEVRGLRSTHGPLRKSEKDRFLAETPYEATSDKRLIEAARKAVGNATSNREKVSLLNAFVHDHIEAQTLDRGYAPAVVTLEEKQGDCTEHAVLLSALLRTQGIPTRLVDGVVITGGMVGYHQWVEVQIDDVGMFPADPTFGEFPATTRRLKLAEGASDAEGLMDLGMAAARILRAGTRIEVLEIDDRRY
ncbi:MAG: transglutaminase domain-containing protein [Deltaproteobacteria bacterium]|nr:transglutaminase domain-containing protein [Deltaproteobacteria bacterium]